MSEHLLSVSDSKISGIIIRLSVLSRDDLLDEIAMAKVFAVRCTRTIKRMVKRYEIPPPILLASKRYWRVGVVLDWINESIERVEKDARHQAQRYRNSV